MTEVTPASVAVHNPPSPYRGEDWETLVSTGQEVFGADLEAGDNLIGMPFVIVAATFRPSDIARPGTKGTGDYVSLDIVIGPDNEIQRGVRRKRISAESAQLFDPGEHLIFNEGGTGVYRQIVAYLESMDWIKLPEGPDQGAYGESRYDTPVSAWQIDRDAATATVGTDGRLTVVFNLRLICPRGLRASDYENEFTKAGRTRYIG
jgi:hypothetical protein